MPVSSTTPNKTFNLEHALQMEHPRLARLCAQISGNAQAADDLAQETLIEAWRNAHKLADPRGFWYWLSAIARNVCRRWARRQGRLQTHQVALNPVVEDSTALQSESIDLAWELERDDLAQLLDQAMALLPSETRQILIKRYLEDSPLAEVAAQLGLTENAASVRLHRGRLALRQVLAQNMPQAVEDYGIIIPDGDGWQDSRIWCPRCGRQRVEGRFSQSEFVLRCPACATEANDFMAQHTVANGLIQSLKTFKPALSRILTWGYNYFQPALETGILACYYCGQPAWLKRCLPGNAPSSRRGQRGFHMHCTHCRAFNYGTLGQFALSIPQVQQFWKEHTRLRMLPEFETTVNNRPGLQITFESLSSQARLDVLLDRSTYQIIGLF